MQCKKCLRMTPGSSVCETFIIGIIEPSEISVKIKATVSPILALQFEQRGRKAM